MTSFRHSLPFLLFKTARPLQWIKNLALYAALLFSGFFFFAPADGQPYFVTVTYAFLVFCLLTSAVYIINDIIDLQADKLHPFKRKRPLASGELPLPIAAFAAVALIAVVFILSMWLPSFFRALILGYFLLQMLYATKTKHIAILDVASIALGFLIRIYAGAVVVNLHMSVWFLLTVVSASLFLAVGKRQSERTLLEGKGETNTNIGETRASLRHYSQRLLDQYTGMFSTATWLTYALFTFQNEVDHPGGRLATFYTLLPRTLQSQKLLMLTLPFVIVGVMRYLQLIYEDKQGESPEKVVLRDKALLAIIIGFGLSVMTIIYVIS